MSKEKVVSVLGDDVLSKLLAKEIGNEDIEVYEVDNGREGLIVIRDKMPVLVVLDIIVPEVDGFTVLGELKGSDETKDIPVVIISILSGEEDIKRCMDLGAEEYIVRSQHNVSEIVDKVRHHLDNRAKR